MNPNTVLCVGYARLPEGMTAEVVFKIFGVGLEIDPESEIIVRAQTTCATILGDDFLTQMFVNKNIITDFEAVLEEVSRRYRGHGSKAIIAAAKKAYAEYLIYKNECNQGLTYLCRMDVKSGGSTIKLCSPPLGSK